jgi:hypothetical protein
MYVGFKSYKPMIYLYVDICLQSFPNFFNVIYWYGNRYYYIESFYSHTCPCSHLYSAVICIKMSHFSLAVIENFIWIEPLLRGNLFYKATVSKRGSIHIKFSMTAKEKCDILIQMTAE